MIVLRIIHPEQHRHQAYHDLIFSRIINQHRHHHHCHGDSAGRPLPQCGEPPLGHIALKPVLRDQPDPEQRVVIALWHDQRLTVSERCDRVDVGKGTACFYVIGTPGGKLRRERLLDNLRSLLRSLPLWHNTAGVWIDHNDNGR